jgi:nucleoid-associated protein YgaU
VPKKINKSTRSVRKVSTKSAKPAASKVVRGFLSQIKWGESYTSLFLGVAVVVVVFVLIFSFFQSRINFRGQTQSTSTVSTEEVVNLTAPRTYTVKEGDYLWSIAEKIYGSGYNWVDLANANKLQNPGVLYVGTKLVVPDVKARVLTVQANSVQVNNPITGNSYTVVKGDYLWNIAVRAYGDGYKWTEIAKANNLTNPDLIFSGNVLKLPR